MKDNFTKIDNDVLENIVKIPFKGCEISVALFIMRKTIGYHKEQDEISLSQLQSGVNRCRQTVVSALKNLYLVNIVRLVQRGSIKNDSNIYTINKNVSTWKVVNTVRLVQRNTKPSLTDKQNLVYTGRHTKERQKKERNIYIQKEFNIIPPSLDMVKAYCLERNNGIDAERFINFYESKNWMIGKNKMKNWHSAIGTWEINNKDKNKPVEKTLEQEARDMYKECGYNDDIAFNRFITKYGIDEAMKFDGGVVWHVFK